MSLFFAIGTMWAQVFPKTSSAESPRYYTIASYNRGGFLTNVGAGKSVEHVATTKGSLWYFTKADENGGLHFCNMAGGFLAADKTVSETAGVWYVLANGVNTEGVAISSTNPISSSSCIDANNTNSGVGAWAPSASDWHGTTWVFAEVTDFSAIFNVDEAKAAAKAELDVLASVSVLYGDVTEAKANVDAVVAEGTSIEQLTAAIAAVNKCVADYKSAAYQALDGKYFTIGTPARGNGFMKLDGNRVVGLAAANSPAAIWQFKHVDGVVNVFNPYTGKYLCEPGNNSENVAVTETAAEAGAYHLVVNASAEKAEAKVKFTSNGKSVHMSGGSVLVRWNDGGASEWTVAEVTDFAEIVTLHKAAALAAVETYAQLPAVFKAAAAKDAINGVTATDWNAFAAIDAAAGIVIPTGKFAFQATSKDNHRNLVWVSANMETSKAIGATEQTENAHWTLKPASGGAFYIYNVANGLYLGNPSGNCALAAEPTAAYTVEVIDAANNVVEFKCGGETLHASNHDDDKLMNYDGNEAASRWTIVAIEEEPEVEYADEAVIGAFIAEVSAIGELPYDLDATWTNLPAVLATLEALDPIIEQIEGGNPVAKADVEAATATVANAKAVATYYNETYLPTAKAATELLAALEKGSAEHTALSAAIAACDLSAVTTVAELETINATLAEAVEANTPEGGVVKTDYTDAIKNASVTSKDDWTIEGDGDVKFGDDHIKTSVKNLNFYQTIVLPAGQYKVTAQAAYRYGSGNVNEAEQAEYDAIHAGTETHLAKLYAETSSYKYEANVQNRWEGASDEDYFKTEGKVSVVAGKYVPNSSAAVKAWFDAGKYVNELVFNVQEDGEVVIGIAKSSTVGDYTNIGAWTLTRLGDAEADPKEEEPGEEPGDEPIETLKPGDVTSLFLVNTDFEQASAQEGGVVNTAPGWTMTWELAGWVDASTRKSENPGNDASQCYNVWAGEFNYVDMCQKVVLPAGIYTVATGFYSDNAAERYVYASIGDQIVKSESPNPGSWDVVSVTFVNEEEGEVTLGVKSHGWFQIDNFTLTYLGASEAEAARSEFLALKDEFDYFSTGIYEVMYVGRVGDAYYALSETVWTLADKADATVEEYEASMAEMKKVMADIEAINEYYVNVFSPLADDCFNVQDNSIATSEEAAAAFEEACDKMGWQGTMRVATIEDLKAIVAAVEPALHDYVQNALPINGYAFNYSFFLTNPSFETGDLTGWTVGTSADTGVKTSTGDYATSGIDGKYLFNTWWQGIMLSQEAEGLPNGNYRLTASLASGDGGKEATIFLVANGEKMGFTMDHKGEFVDYSIEFKVTDGKVSIATIGGNDDKSYNENGHWWYKSDNYRIYYLGDGGVTGVSLWTEETYIDEWSGEEMEYDLEWDMPNLTEIGQTFQFKVNVEAPEDADKTITWSVSNDKVLSIDETGLLTVIGSGKGFYEVKATAPNGISASCKVRVEAFQEGDVTEMEFTEWWIDLVGVGATYQLEVTYKPADAVNVDFVWTSSDETVATVDQNGLVTAVGEGWADITVTAPSGASASITVYVEIPEDETGIEAVEADANVIIYDLSGRRVNEMTKGIYIVNGKKIIKK